MSQEEKKGTGGRGSALGSIPKSPVVGRGVILGRGRGLGAGASGSSLLSKLSALKSFTSSDESDVDPSKVKASSLIATLTKLKTLGVSRGRGVQGGRGAASDSSSPNPVGVLSSSSGGAKDSAYISAGCTTSSDINENIPLRKPVMEVPKVSTVIESPPKSPPQEKPVSKETTPTKKPVDASVPNRNVTSYQGTGGRPTNLHANCVALKCINKAVYEYFVSFSPELDNLNLRYSLLNEHREIIESTKAFDGSVLFLPKRLPSDETYLTSERRTDGATITIKIQLIRALHPTSPLLLRFYNIILHRIMKILKLCPVGRNYYDPTLPENIDRHGVVLWPGFVTSIRELEGGLYLTIDVSHKVLRKETVMDVMRDIYKKDRNNFQEMCLKELVGSTVLTRYNNRTYRIDDVDFVETPKSTFTTFKGETLSFQEYYKTQYKIDIKDLNQPMLLNRPKTSTKRAKREEEGRATVCSLIPELCFLTGLSDKIASDFSAMKDIGKVTRLAPDIRNTKLVQFINRINSTTEACDELKKWGLELDNDTLALTGRAFPPEKVLVGNNRVFQCNEEADFGRDVTRNSVIRGIDINNWVMLFITRDKEKANYFTSKLRECGGKLGIKVAAPQMICLDNDRAGTYRNALVSVINQSLQLVVCMFPFAREDRYNAVKKLCCVEMPVPSQVILSKTLPQDEKSGKFRSVTMKVALQINAKLGGELWALEIPLKKLMVCGIDVYHEGKGKGKSVAVLVASMNNRFTRWHSRASIQLPQQEIIDSLKHCFTEILTKYYEINNYLPDRIVLYRDGVGDGQLDTVSKYEVLQLKEALKMLDNLAGGSYEPKLTVVVVSKRINLRYFQNTGRDMKNPPPGVVLDNSVTRANWPDFFLVSQHVRQGTVSPTHYICVNGKEHLKPDHLQRLTYKLTHMYYNWPGTIRVPAPCQYAHKMAYLVGENLGAAPAMDLCNRLFYL